MEEIFKRIQLAVGPIDISIVKRKKATVCKVHWEKEFNYETRSK